MRRKLRGLIFQQYTLFEIVPEMGMPYAEVKELLRDMGFGWENQTGRIYKCRNRKEG